MIPGTHWSRLPSVRRGGLYGAKSLWCRPAGVDVVTLVGCVADLPGRPGRGFPDAGRSRGQYLRRLANCYGGRSPSHRRFSHAGGWQHCLETSGGASLHFLRWIPDFPPSPWRGDAHLGLGLTVSGGRDIRYRPILQGAIDDASYLDSARRYRHPAARIADLRALAVQFGMGNWNTGRREPDLQRRNARHGLVGRPQADWGSAGTPHVVSGLRACLLLQGRTHSSVPAMAKPNRPSAELTRSQPFPCRSPFYL